MGEARPQGGLPEGRGHHDWDILPSAASRMVVWLYRSEMSSGDQLKGTSGSVKEKPCCARSALRLKEAAGGNGAGGSLEWRPRRAGLNPSAPASGHSCPCGCQGSACLERQVLLPPANLLGDPEKGVSPL